jgi:SAM-dependent methyltransferase
MSHFTGMFLYPYAMKKSAFVHKFNWKVPSEWGFEINRSLDFGCGDNPRNPFRAQTLFGIDIVEQSSSFEKEEFLEDTEGQRATLNRLTISRFQKLPIQDAYFDAVTMFDVLEHLSREPRDNSNEFISTLNEVHRVLKPGGIFFAVTPCFPSPASFQDPTHINIITEATSSYFVGKSPPAQNFGYGFAGEFELIAQFWVGPQNSFMAKGYKSTFRMGPNLKSSWSIPGLRSKISSLRSPTHLAWLFRRPTY